MSVILDTCVIISRKPRLVPSKYFTSVVVLQELIAGASDASEAKAWIAFGQQASKLERLLVPDQQDWIECGRILNLLLRGLKAKHGGGLPSFPVRKSNESFVMSCLREQSGELAVCLSQIIHETLSRSKTTAK